MLPCGDSAVFCSVNCIPIIAAIDIPRRFGRAYRRATGSAQRVGPRRSPRVLRSSDEPSSWPSPSLRRRNSNRKRRKRKRALRKRRKRKSRNRRRCPLNALPAEERSDPAVARLAVHPRKRPQPHVKPVRHPRRLTTPLRRRSDEAPTTPALWTSSLTRSRTGSYWAS